MNKWIMLLLPWLIITVLFPSFVWAEVTRSQLENPSVSAGLGADMIGQVIKDVGKLAELRAINPAGIAPESVYLRERGGGFFVWNAADLSVGVSKDTHAGVYVAPDFDLTGSSGAWVRQNVGAIKVKWFGAIGDGVTDDSGAIQAAVDFVRNLSYRTEDAKSDTTFNVSASMRLVFSPGGYVITTPIDMTGIRRSHSWWYVEARGAVFFLRTTGKTGFDLMNSRKCSWTGGTIIGEQSYLPQSGIQLARNFSGAVADTHHFQDLEVKGYFSWACIYNYASEDVYFEDVALKNDYNSSDAYCLIQDGTNYWGVTSDFNQNPPQHKARSFLRNTFIRFDARKTNAGGALWIDLQANNHDFISSYLVAHRDHAVKIFSNRKMTDSVRLRFDVHIETDSGDLDKSTGLDHCFIFDSSTPNLTMDLEGFLYHDNDSYCQEAVFASTSNVKNVRFFDADVYLGKLTRNVGQTIFDNPKKYRYSGKLHDMSPVRSSFDIKGLGAFYGEYFNINSTRKGHIDVGSFTLRNSNASYFKNSVRIMGNSSGSSSLEHYMNSGEKAGEIAFSGNAHRFIIGGKDEYVMSTKSLYPATDNANSLGLANRMWSQIYTNNGTVNTSDERLKNFYAISVSEIAAAKKIKLLLGKFRFKADEKSGVSKFHFGVGAQSVIEVLIEHGLNPDDYAMIVYDSWVDESGNKVDQYGIRYDQLLAFILTAL